MDKQGEEGVLATDKGKKRRTIASQGRTQCGAAQGRKEEWAAKEKRGKIKEKKRKERKRKETKGRKKKRKEEERKEKGETGRKEIEKTTKDLRAEAKRRKAQFRAQQQQQREQEQEQPQKAMANNNNNANNSSVKDHAYPNIEDFMPSITKPRIKANNFELKPALYQMVQ
ncbi:stress response protein NST1-like [Hevea brasiliensis]|uniref:stress response protein NST1-like n=1 Tax=Hevea brasiliensis TaxID=3981 RepID=UPI0025DFA510|nr:stress response protein NST1-like [Hevea brasiliensis]